ncbi:Cell division protein FtsH [Pseudoalteromonas luteoviolacea B = ATCC 29581]|nr:Cell division protein FtsH [Pseudoalteromonas luteoviolacea B = ATCC 29581]
MKSLTLPIGIRLAENTNLKKVIKSDLEGKRWILVETSQNNKALVVDNFIYDSWFSSNLISNELVNNITFGDENLKCIVIKDGLIDFLTFPSGPDSKNDAIIFAKVYKTLRGKNPDVDLSDAIYIESLALLLPLGKSNSKITDDLLIGKWLTSGFHISVMDSERVRKIANFLSEDDVKDIISISGLNHSHYGVVTKQKNIDSEQNPSERMFILEGREYLQNFFNEYVVDIVENREKYKRLGVSFPSAIALHGPPGCGKTYAVDKLVDYLGWPKFEIDASSIASPYIHETSKKIAEVFDKAIDNSPSVIVIDEMDAFLSKRGSNSGNHQIEEVSEFLRRIPEASENDVLIIGMTNRLEALDPAILRTGRFDHSICVDYASKEEIRSLLNYLLSDKPTCSDLDIEPYVQLLEGRPLSDVSFLIKESARLTAKHGKDSIDNASLDEAYSTLPKQNNTSENRIGFI